jgi:hypothetical protein
LALPEMRLPFRGHFACGHQVDRRYHTGSEAAFFEELRLATLDIGFPCFLRTDHTSAKHSWNETCFVESFSNLGQHVFNIAEFSEIADMIGLPWDTWVVREFLPTIPIGVCERYGNMPVCHRHPTFYSVRWRPRAIRVTMMHKRKSLRCPPAFQTPWLCEQPSRKKVHSRSLTVGGQP